MKRRSKQDVEKELADAVEAFLAKLVGPERTPTGDADDALDDFVHRDSIVNLVWSAYRLFHLHYGSTGAAHWFLVALDEPAPFAGRVEPWCVLLREAVYLSRRYVLNLPLEGSTHEDEA